MVGAPIVVRVLEYTIDDPGRPQASGQTYRLVTTILDPELAPASELAALYHQRWELEGVLDELKTHPRGAQRVLRSKTPAMVEQEVRAHLLVHYAIRKLMHQAALERDLDPDRLSLSAAYGSCAVTWSATSRFPPDEVTAACRVAIAEILTERLPVRRLRAFARAVKRKMSNFAAKRSHHRQWPQPTRPDAEAVVVLPRAG